MGKYLHLFETKSAHDTVYNGEGYIEPWVGYITADTTVTYNKPHDYSKDYFTVEALEDGNVYFKYLSFATTEDQRYIEYSKDNGETWVRTTNVDNEEVIMTIPLLTGEKALVRGNNDTFCAYNEDEDEYFSSFFYSDIEFNVYGNIMSLIHGDGFIGETSVVENMFKNLFFDSWGDYDGDSADCMVVNAKDLILPATTLSQSCYRHMFHGCTSLTTAPELPATTLALSCYEGMFEGCTSLTTAPELPATTLTTNCYGYMFDGCTSLVTAPVLPATTLASSCYSSMFAGCTSLTTAPALPATTLANYCYQYMFQGCTSFTTAPELPATMLAPSCYFGMFRSCTSLTTVPDLPATTLADSCYSYMFLRCTSLTTSPSVLPATTLADSCYNSMFSGCIALTTAPELPATTLAVSCYSSMFNGCTSLTTSPSVLPATTLADSCYFGMFEGCTSLTIAPSVLPATTLANSCYSYMFNRCTSLNYIKAMFTTTPSSTYTDYWVSGVASTGTFVKNSAATWNVTGINGIPTGWTVQTASA